MQAKIIQGDCLDVMAGMPDASIDAIVTDPPYGLSFMGKDWDKGVPGEAFWREALRIAKPGCHILAAGGSRTYHRLAVAIEDAGWEIRDCVMWIYGSGFPKSLDVSKAIDKDHGENRERQLQFTAWMRSTGITAEQINEATGSCMASHYLTDKSQPAIATADTFDKLRPYLPKVPEYIERLVSERTGLEWTSYKRRGFYEKPTGGLHGGTGNTVGAFTGRQALPFGVTDAARQWQGWGTALKPAFEPFILARKPLDGTVAANVQRHGCGGISVDRCRVEVESWIKTPATTDAGLDSKYLKGKKPVLRFSNSEGRWPANVIHDGSDEVTHLFGSAARFFYCPKASRSERDAGLDGMEETCRLNDIGNKWATVDYRDGHEPNTKARNHHPTVKPVELMAYLCRLVTPPNGMVLDPFCGSGSTGVAAIREGFNFTGIELNPEYVEIAKRRISHEREKAALLA